MAAPTPFPPIAPVQRGYDATPPASDWERVSIEAHQPGSIPLRIRETVPFSSPEGTAPDAPYNPSDTMSAAHPENQAAPAANGALANPGEKAKSGFERVLDAVRSAIPVMQKLLPLLDGNFATAVSALIAPQHPAAPQPAQVDFEPVERGLEEVRTSNRELRNQVAEQSAVLKQVEDQLERVREATDRNTLEQQELLEDLRSVGGRVSTFALIGILLLLLSLGLNGYLIWELHRILR